MQADYSVELGQDDPVLEMPWSSEDEKLCYFDVKRHPELLSNIPEAQRHPELGSFLARINAAEFPLESAKCDAWFSQEISPEEEIFGAASKFVSYVDLIFSEDELRSSFKVHEKLAKDLCSLLARAPEISGSVELIIRRCYSRSVAGDGVKLPEDQTDRPGFAMSCYVSGFGGDEHQSGKNWTIALALLRHALVQVANQVSR